MSLLIGDSAAMPAGVARLPFVDGMRALAALFVLFIHAFYEPSLGAYSQKWLYRLGVSYHRVPVDVFIVLSGFCLMLPIARRGLEVSSWRSWFWRRSRRILPPYFAAVFLSLVLSLLVINPWAHHIRSYIAGEVPLRALLAYLVLVQDVVGVLQELHNPPLWSISVEWRIYFCMPLVLLSLRRWGNLPTLAFTIGFGLGVDHFFGDFINMASPWYVALFAMGAVAARSVVEGRVTRFWSLGAFGCGLFFFAIIAVKRVSFYQQHGAWFGLLVGAGTALFIGACARRALSGSAGPLLGLLSSRPLAALGVFSYSIYLIHNPLLRVMHLALESSLTLSPERMLALLVAATPLYLLLAYLFHRVVERPFMASEGGRGPARVMSAPV